MAQKKTTTRVEDIDLSEVSLVDHPANPGADVALFKHGGAIDKGMGGCCGDCKTPGDCKASDHCALEDKPLSKAADIAGNDDDAKARDFNEVRAEEEARQAANRMLDPLWTFTSALRDSLESIVANAAATDKATMARASLNQFEAAVLAMFGATVNKSDADTVSPGAGDAGQVVPNTEGSMADENKAEITKADYEALVKSNKDMAEKLTKMEEDKRTQEAVTKAATLDALPIKAEEFAAVLKAVPAEHEPELMRVLTAANSIAKRAQGIAAFGETGSSVAKADAGGESPLVKAAKAEAERAKA